MCTIIGQNNMTVMSAKKGIMNIKRQTKEPEKETIHSGHFMVSEFEADDQDDEDEVAVPVPEEEIEPKSVTSQPGTVAQLSKYNIKPKTNLKQQLSIETSLTKLFQCMSLAYRQKLTSPKWNRFKGIRLRWKDKIRLNNVIWRCWHMQFVNKKRTLVCQFASPLDIDTHNKPEAVVMEGKYWKRRLHAVTAEYKKWRMFYRNKLLGKKDAHDVLFELDSLEWQASSMKDNSMMVDEDYMEFMSDTLFTTITANQPFAFPDTREIARGAGIADFIQPSLVQLQPNLDDFMDLEPFQDLLQSKLVEEGGGYDGCLGKGQAGEYYSNSSGASNWVIPGYTPPVTPDLPSQSFQAPAVPPTPLVIHRPPITTTTNTFPVIKSKGGKNPSVGKTVLIRAPPPSSSQLQTPLLNQMLTGGSGNYSVVRGEMGLRKGLAGGDQTAVLPVTKNVTTFQPSSYGHIRLVDNSTLLYQTSNCSPLVKENEQFVRVASSSIPLAPAAQTSQPSTVIAPLPPVNQIPPAMTFVGTPGSPNSPVNNGSMSPVNLGSPSSSPSPSKTTQFKGHRRTVHINAEQKRRCNIKNGFDTLHSLLPQTSQNANTKVSKAVLLQKGAEFIKQLKNERLQLEQEMEGLRQQVDYLNSAISNCQDQLPATGAPISKQKSGKLMDMYRQFIQLRTHDNWKFWILSLICEPLLVSFSDCVSTASIDQFYNSTLQWVDQHCTLVDLRPVMLNALRRLCTMTEVLSDPGRLSIEAKEAVDSYSKDS